MGFYLTIYLSEPGDDNNVQKFLLLGKLLLSFYQREIASKSLWTMIWKWFAALLKVKVKQ